MQKSEIAFFLYAKENEIQKLLSVARNKIAEELGIINENQFIFCWIVDYPMFDYDEKSKKIDLVTIHFRCRS